MISILMAFLLTLIIAHGSQFLLHRTLRPTGFSSTLLFQQSLAVSSIYLVILMLTQRPFLSIQLTLSVLAVFLVVNAAKYKALKEPLAFSDIYLYIQVVRHPRLFLPFLNIPLTLTAIVIGVALLYIAVRIEPAIHLSINTYLVLIVLLIACITACRQLSLNAPLTFDLTEDIKQHGFYNNLLNYGFQSESTQQKQTLKQSIQRHTPFGKDTQQTNNRPNIITIQSESFFDVRRLCIGVGKKTLQHFDELNSEALASGTLTVPAWGANTLRPEFAFLSGVDNMQLKHYRFNPYQYLHDTPTPTIASYLKSIGYHCIAIHPNSSAFFGRDKVFPLFGFDEFIDITDFDPTAISGPYISDHAVGEKIEEIINQYNNKQPLFIFVITMENHGPLHLESANAHDIKQHYHSTPPKQHNDLTVYLRHLHNADQMLKNLRDFLKSQQQETLLCFYGDHVPSMPDIYSELEFTDGRTDYLIWNNRQQHSQTGQSEPLSVHQLALTLLNTFRQSDG
uniref:Capsular polysaccharide biosynthesis protein WcbQ n=1 Tax=uncultured Thiotrichaceae bacterium TaxID=298394 RepID=A0A6S6UGL4_9GAMM|nr:MAG: Capsular polysaccharide biosynthesis protein WcbQ [uncultured Thiotrichaceae bacterium]